MATQAKIIISKLTYSELLATTPWIALLPNAFAGQCEWGGHPSFPSHNRCKTAARLLYIDLDGQRRLFCHHHLYDARMDYLAIEKGEPGYEEIRRNLVWQRRTLISREKK